MVDAARGAVAQLGARLNRTQEVRGSNPLGSTKQRGRPMAALASLLPGYSRSPRNTPCQVCTQTSPE